MKNVFGYLHNSPTSSNLAKFSIIGSSTSEKNDGERRVHRELIVSLAPQLDQEVDQIILAEGGEHLLQNICNFLYCGR